MSDNNDDSSGKILGTINLSADQEDTGTITGSFRDKLTMRIFWMLTFSIIVMIGASFLEEEQYKRVKDLWAGWFPFITAISGTAFGMYYQSNITEE